jgi:hypothetical protein
VSDAVDVHAAVRDGAVHLTWDAQPTHAGNVFYRIFRGRDAVRCGGRLNDSADDCRLFADAIGVTRRTQFVDRPPPGKWTYHVGVAANWLDDPTLGDVYVLSAPAPVNAP